MRRKRPRTNAKSGQPFNPLDKGQLAQSLEEALRTRSIHKLPPDEPFTGAGIYAIYYTGSFPLYAAISERNKDGLFQQPIYVGKAVPEGARKGLYGIEVEPKTVLYDRLAEHAESIQQVNNLKIEDFCCRYLVTDEIWIPLGESITVAIFKPIWNMILDGFGIHDPGKGRAKQRRSAWDVLHPGRRWAKKLRAGKFKKEELEDKVQAFLSPPSEENADGGTGPN